MDERIVKAEYRVGRNVFLMLGVLFSLLAVNVHFLNLWLFALMGGLAVLLIVYAIVKYVTGERLRTLIEAEKKNKPTKKALVKLSLEKPYLVIIKISQPQ